jgi:hypothetical protein
MKLKDWADKTGIKYLTAYRWFKAGTLPVEAYQTSSGTIIVQDESETTEKPMNSPQPDVMSIILKKTVELSKANGTIEDFAAFVLTNFTLKPIINSDAPRYSRNKPRSEDIQNHFKQFIKPKGEKPKPNMFMATEEVIDDLVSKQNFADKNLKDLGEDSLDFFTMLDASKIDASHNFGEMVDEIHKRSEEVLPAAKAFVAPEKTTGFIKYGDMNPFNGQTLFSCNNVTKGVEGSIPNVDVTPQQLNYTGSTNTAFDTTSCSVTSGAYSSDSLPIRLGSFLPTQKEVDTVKSLIEKPRRGRKSHKLIGNK